MTSGVARSSDLTVCPEADVGRVLTMSARALIEQEPNYSYVAARLLLDALRHEALSCLRQQHEVATQPIVGPASCTWMSHSPGAHCPLPWLDEQSNIRKPISSV